MKRNKNRILVIIGLLGLLSFLFESIDLACAKDPDYPTKPIEFLIGMGPGGTTDLACRAFADAASKHLGQPIVPINKLGGGGTVAVMAAKTAKPDGYTIASISSSIAFVPPFMEGAPYKDLDGFTWLTNFGTYIWPLLVRGDAPWRTWNEFIEWAKKNPRAAKVGITAAKTADYKGLTLWQIEQKENVELTCLAFKGGPEVLAAILGGHINLYASTVDPTTKAYIKEGKLRLLAYMGVNKVVGYESIPSTKELYGFGIPDMLAVIGPKGLPNYVSDKLDFAFGKAVKDPSFIKVMNQMDTPVVYMNKAQLGPYVNEEFLKTAKIYEKVKAEEAKRQK